MSSVAQTGTKPPTLSALRSARAEVVADLLAWFGGPTTLNALKYKTRDLGLTNGQTERAVDDLADAGRVTVTTSAYGTVVVRPGGAA